jgi:hypothetical protein
MAVVEPMDASNCRHLRRRGVEKEEESVARISNSSVQMDGVIALPGFRFAVRHRGE